MSPSCFKDFLTFWQHKLLLAYFVFSLFQGKSQPTFSRSLVPGEPTLVGQTSCPPRRAPGEKLTHPLQCPRKRRKDFFFPHQKAPRWQNRGAKMWVFYANQAVGGLLPMSTSHIYGFCDSWQDYQNSTVHGSLSKVFKYDAKPRMSPCIVGCSVAVFTPVSFHSQPFRVSHIRVVMQLSHQSASVEVPLDIYIKTMFKTCFKNM